MYIFGRDKYFRPTFVVDGGAISRCQREDPNTISVQSFTEMLTYMTLYVRKCMFLKGHIEQWVTIMDLNSLSMFKLPREVLLTMVKVCQENLMFVLFKSFYVQAGFDTRMFYKAISWAFDPVTKQKIFLSAERNPTDLINMYHPCQLE